MENPRELTDCTSKWDIRWYYTSIRNMSSWCITSFLSRFFKNVLTNPICEAFEGWELHLICPSEVQRDKLLESLAYGASSMSASRMCPSSTWTRTIFCNKIICKSSYVSYPSQLVPCHPPRTTSERAVLVETSTLTTNLLQYVIVQCNEDLSNAYVQWRSNDKTMCYSPATYKRKLGSSELGNFDRTFFLSDDTKGLSIQNK